MLIGYMRPYENDKECQKQYKLLTSFNCKSIYLEDHIYSNNRNELNKMLSNLNKDDKIIVTKFFSIADSIKDLLNILEQIKNKGAFIMFIQEKFDTSGESGGYLENFIRNLLILQSDLIREKTKKGMLEAKEKGIFTGRPRKPSDAIQRAIDMYNSNSFSLIQIKEETGISKSSLYRYLKENKNIQ